MCGIAGIIKINSGEEVSEAELRRLAAPMRHRGPDDQGTFLEGNVGLVHNRLSIIDLSTGHQPIFNEDGSVLVIFNGEIYNFRELREKLESSGHRFSTNSDTEAIVHAYEEYGPDCLSHLKGMFAFAVYDRKRRSLLLARDRLGEKPLKYFWDGQRLIFSSELKSILAMDGIDRDLDPDALSAYFSLLCVPAPLTVFRHIRKLPPGSYALFQDGQLVEQRYWQVGYKPAEREKTEEEYIEEIDRMLREAVRSCMISDVPIGVFLSGGIDSSLITSYLAELSDQPIRTFSVGFGKTINELPYAQAVADMYRTRHTVLNVDANVGDVIEKVVWYFEEPFADSSAVPTYLISQEARKHVKVILAGEGGDELFGGYDGYVDLPRIILLGEAKTHVGRYALRLLYKLERDTGGSFGSLYWRMARKYPDIYYRFYKTRRMFSEEEKSLLIKGAKARETFSVLRDRLSPDTRREDQSVAFDINAYLPEDLLVKADLASMANSLETRAPFLDYQLAEAAFNMPMALKTRNGMPKYLLKKLAERRLPAGIIYRRKQGFGAPVDEWLRTDLKEMALARLTDPAHVAFRHIDYDYTAHLIARYFREGQQDLAYRVWTILIFALWCEQYLEPPTGRGSSVRHGQER